MFKPLKPLTYAGLTLAMTYAGLTLAMTKRLAASIISSQSSGRSLYSIRDVTMLEQLENIAAVGFI